MACGQKASSCEPLTLLTIAQQIWFEIKANIPTHETKKMELCLRRPLLS